MREHEVDLGFRFSFDMLGEAARTDDDAKRYAARYREAVEAIAPGRPTPQARRGRAASSGPGFR